MAVKRNATYFRFKKQANTDIKQMADAFHESLGQIDKSVKVGLKQAVNIIGDESLRLAPIDTGALRDSQYRIIQEDKKNSLKGIVGYYSGFEEPPEGEVINLPGSPAPYAVYVHERMDQFHKSPTQAKFLSEAFANKFIEAINAVYNRAKAVMRGKK